MKSPKTPTSPYIYKGLNRREAIKATAIGGFAGSGLASTLGMFNSVAAATATDYKALVCCYLFGGNDQSNTIIPASGSAYDSYQAARPSLALATDAILPISPQAYSGPPLAFSPHLVGLRNLFEQGHCAVTANLGTLAYPTTKAAYDAGTVALPFQIFSHSDQTNQWQTGLPDAVSRTGWMGRIGDLLASSYNASNSLSMAMSLAGNNMMQVGQDIIQYQLNPSGPIAIEPYYGGGPFWGDIPTQNIKTLLTQPRAHLMESTLSGLINRAISSESLLTNALAAAPALQTVFPDTYLGQQAKMVAQMIGINQTLGQRRQMFFISAGGYDMHSDLLNGHREVLTELDQALTALYNATVELGLASNVTTFTASDFGRALQYNGDGSDHGWGSHHFMIGGAVRGRRVYGQFPTVALDGPEDAGQGRLIPTTSTDQYISTLARWFGVSMGDIATIVPNIGRFATSDLGFLS